MSTTGLPITTGTGTASVATEIVGGNSFQQIEVLGPGGASVLSINPDGSIKASIIGIVSISATGGSVGLLAGTSAIGNVAINGGSVQALQGTSPWIITGSVQASLTPAANQSVSGTVGASVIGTVPVTQTTNPWIITGSVQASITPAANQSVSGTVGASIIGQLPAGTAVLGSVAALQSTNPWIVSSSIAGGIFPISGSVAAVITNTSVNVSGSVVGFQGGARTISGSVLTVLAPVASLIAGVTSILTTTTQVSVLATPAGAQRYYITQIMATNAATTGTFVDIYDGPNIVFSGFAAASGGGFATQFPTPLRITNLNTAVGTAIRTAASVITNVTGYTGA